MRLALLVFSLILSGCASAPSAADGPPAPLPGPTPSTPSPAASASGAAPVAAGPAGSLQGPFASLEELCGKPTPRPDGSPDHVFHERCRLDRADFRGNAAGRPIVAVAIAATTMGFCPTILGIQTERGWFVSEKPGAQQACSGQHEPLLDFLDLKNAKLDGAKLIVQRKTNQAVMLPGQGNTGATHFGSERQVVCDLAGAVPSCQL